MLLAGDACYFKALQQVQPHKDEFGHWRLMRNTTGMCADHEAGVLPSSAFGLALSRVYKERSEGEREKE